MYIEGKRKMKENYNCKIKKSNISDKIQKIESILNSHRRNNSSCVYMNSQDINDFETAQLLSLNRRDFGNHFKTNIKCFVDKPRLLSVRDYEISPENTILDDIEFYRQNILGTPKINISHKDSELEIKPNEDERIEKIQSMNPLNKFIFAEMKKIQPKNSNEIYIRHKLALESRLKKQLKVLNKKDSPIRSPYFSKQSVRDVKFLKTRRLSNDDEQLIKQIKLESNNFSLQGRLNRLVTTRQHLASIKKEIKL